MSIRKPRSPSTLCSGATRQVACGPLDAESRNGWSQATAVLASRAMDRSADRVRRWASFRRLWAVQTMLHSACTFSRPRNRNWRNPRASLICPNTGSGNCAMTGLVAALD